jgi:hypothetical protein
MQGFRQAEIVALGGEPLLQQRRLLRHDLQADLRVARQKRLQQQRQKRLGKHRQAGDRQLALAELAQALGGADDAVQSVPGALNLFKQPQPLHRRLQAPAGAFKQLQPEHLFKARQLAADGRLRGMQQSRLRSVAGGHHRMKDFDMA